MYGFKVIFGGCLLFLLGVAIYFLFTGGYAESNIDTYRGLQKGDRLDGWALLLLFFILGGLYIIAIGRTNKRNKDTDYRK